MAYWLHKRYPDKMFDRIVFPIIFDGGNTVPQAVSPCEIRKDLRSPIDHPPQACQRYPNIFLCGLVGQRLVTQAISSILRELHLRDQCGPRFGHFLTGLDNVHVVLDRLSRIWSGCLVGQFRNRY